MICGLRRMTWGEWWGMHARRGFAAAGGACRNRWGKTVPAGPCGAKVTLKGVVMTLLKTPMTFKTPMIRVIHAQFPAASAVHLVGEFNDWSNSATPMLCVGLDIWEARLDASAHLREVWFFVLDAGQNLGRLVHGCPADSQLHNA